MAADKVKLKNSLGGKILLFGVFPMILVLAGIIVYTSIAMFFMARAKNETSLRNLANEVAIEVERGNTRAVLATQVMAFAQENGMFGNRTESNEMARRVLDEFPEFTGSYFGYEPNADQNDQDFLNSDEAVNVKQGLSAEGRFIPYWFRGKTDNTKLFLEPLVDMESSLYYQGAKDLFHEAGEARPMVTEPYVYEGKMIVEQTYPIVIGGKFKGIAGVDRALDDILKFIQGIKNKQSVDIFLISRAGKFIAATTEQEKDLKTKAIEETPYRDLMGPFYENRKTRSFKLTADPFDNLNYYYATAPIPTGPWMAILRKSEKQITDPILQDLFKIISVALLGLIAVIALSMWLTRSITRRLENAASAANLVASGAIPDDLALDTRVKDEVGQINQSFNRVIDAFREITEVCIAVAHGDFSKAVKKRSDQDQLADAINTMTAKRKQAEHELQLKTLEIEKTHSLKSGLHELRAFIQGEQDISKYSSNILNFLVSFLDLPLGAVYVLNREKQLQRMAIHGYPKNSNAPDTIDIGSGLIGQAAASRKPVSVNDIPEYARIALGFGEVAPRSLMMFPLIYNEELLGVLELGNFEPFDEGQIDWLEDASQAVASGIRSCFLLAERKQAEDELRKLSQAVEQSPAIVMITNPDGDIEYVNPKFEEVTEYSVEEVLGKNPRFLKSGKTNPREYEDLWKTIISGNEWHGEFQNKKKSGELYWEAALISPIMSADETITHYLGVKEDITERKKAEEELKVAMQKAESADQAKSDFLANMSHEIRTPMNAIIGMSHLALNTDLTPKQHNYLNKIHNSGKVLLGIINDILDFSKIEAGKLDLENIDFHLAEVLDNLSTLITMKAHEKGLEILFSLDPDVPTTLVGDPLRLGQILVNLANNAVKFTDHGEVIVAIESLKQEEDRVTLQFSVKDTGIGLSQEEIGRLFQSFSQADASTTRKYGGTGLGLTICKQLVEKMGGDIRVESEPGKGSSFIFTAVFGCASAERREHLVPARDLKDLRVLVVDDNRASREILQGILDSWSFKPALAASGEEALAELEQAGSNEPFDLVLMDWKMSGMDGIETSRRIKSNNNLTRQPKIIMLTAYGREEVWQQAEKIGLDGFLIKPVNPSMLLQIIMEVFGRKTRKRSLPQAGSATGPKSLQTLAGARVLLVEDNEINQELAVELLEQVGLIVSVANNGKEAVEKVSNNEFDGVLMDMQMPVMDGLEATRMIRQNRKLNSLPIIAMTANAMAGDREKCLVAGMNDHVAKPIDPNHLYSTLAQWIKPGASTPSGSIPHVEEKSAHPDDGPLPDLPGIDVKSGLSRVGENEKLYRKLLVKFYREYSDGSAKIKAALDKDDLKTAKLLAHTIKGIAGNIGADKLQTSAAELECAIRDQKKDQFEQFLDQFSRDLSATMASLSALESTQSEEDKGLLDLSQIKIPDEILVPLKEAVQIGLITDIEKHLADIKLIEPLGSRLADHLKDLTDMFEKDRVLEILNSLESHPQDLPAATPEILMESLKGIQPHLKSGKPRKCSEAMKDILKLSWPSNLNSDVKDLERTIGKYKFKDAQTVVESLIQKLETIKTEHG